MKTLILIVLLVALSIYWVGSVINKAKEGHEFLGIHTQEVTVDTY